MVNLTFGEQVKIILSRKGMTIKELAEKVQERTGKNMSRQNMTQRLGRDNFQEQDMRLIAEILGCSFQLSIMEQENSEEMQVAAAPKKTVSAQAANPVRTAAPAQSDAKEPTAPAQAAKAEKTIVTQAPLAENERDITVGELVQMNQELESVIAKEKKPTSKAFLAEEENLGEINPYTRKEYETNSVRMHPKKIGYVQVYDQEKHTWTDMTEWAFLGYQERKKMLLGKDYVPPIYLD